jgi:hypothetical protein
MGQSLMCRRCGVCSAIVLVESGASYINDFVVTARRLVVTDVPFLVVPIWTLRML